MLDFERVTPDLFRYNDDDDRFPWDDDIEEDYPHC